MNIETNEKLIKRNSRIAQVSMFAGLLALVAALIISFRYQELIWLSLIGMLLGLILSQIGIYYTNRWARRPRPDELLNRALKGLDNKYCLYHYKSPVSHLLIGPSGIWILSPRHQRGIMSFSKGRWRQKGGNLYLKLFAQEGIGRPDLEIAYEVEKMQKFLYDKLPDKTIPPINAALIFTNDNAVIQIDDTEKPPAITLHLKKLKDYLRKVAKGKPISMEIVNNLQRILSDRPQVY